MQGLAGQERRGARGERSVQTRARGAFEVPLPALEDPKRTESDDEDAARGRVHPEGLHRGAASRKGFGIPNPLPAKGQPGRRMPRLELKATWSATHRSCPSYRLRGSSTRRSTRSACPLSRTPWRANRAGPRLPARPTPHPPPPLPPPWPRARPRLVEPPPCRAALRRCSARRRPREAAAAAGA